MNAQFPQINSHTRPPKAFRLDAIRIGIVSLCLLALSGCKKNESSIAALESKNTKINSDQVSDTAPSLSSKPDQQKGISQKAPVTVKKPAFLMTRKGRTYNRSQLHKNQTLLLYAFDPDVRADYTFYHVRNLLTKEQFKICKELAMSYEPEFQEIIRKRAAVLETAYDDDPELEDKLLNLKMDTADVVQNIRSRIFREILTDPQREIEKQKNKEYLAQQAIEQAREEEAFDKDQKKEVENPAN